MRVWIVELGEPLPFQREQRLLRYGELSRVLADRGHQVTWWACDFSHQTHAFIGPANGRVESGGIDMVLVHGTGYQRNAGLARLRHIAVHARNLERLISAEAPPDVILAAMPTIEASFVVAQYARRHNVPLIVDIRDEWPEDYVRWLPQALRPIGRLALAGHFAKLRKVCRSATSLASVTERQLEYGLTHAGRPRRSGDAVFYTGARSSRPDSARVAEQLAKWRQRGLAETDFVCVFAGTMSASRPLGATIEAVKRLSATIPIKAVFAGKGDLETQYRQQASDSPAIVFAGWVDATEMAALYEMADVLLAPYNPLYGFSMPTKIFDYFAAGRPLVSSCPGEAEALLTHERLGRQVNVDDVEGIARALADLYHDPAERQAMGRRARALFERDFAIEAIMERYADYIERVGGPAGSRVA